MPSLMAKKVVADGDGATAKRQRVIEEEKRTTDEKIDFSLEFTPSEERAWLHEERCNTLVLVVSIIVAFVVGLITAIIAKTMGVGVNAAVIDTVIVFVIAASLKKITSPVVRMYVAKNYDPAVAAAAGGDMLSSRSIAGSVFMYLVMALGSCIMFLPIV